MRAYVCFDDTDILGSDRGTGKLVRWFTKSLPDGCSWWGVVRQQLIVHPDVPYTSHNSSACVVLDIPDASMLPELARLGAEHIAEHFIDGSDPGLCVAADRDLDALVAFGQRAAVEVVTQAEAYAAAASCAAHLSGHGGTCDGIIGAAAGVGLTAGGWAGRLIDYHVSLRGFADVLTVGEVETAGITVVPVDRNVMVPKPSDILDTQRWLRPRLWGGRAVLPVMNTSPGHWTAIARRPLEEGLH